MSPATYALVVDDHPLVARGVAEFLRSRLPSLEVLEAAMVDDVTQVLDSRGAPRIALIDFWLADGAALPLVAMLRRRCPAAALAIMSGDDDPAIQQSVRHAGAHAFIPKNVAPHTFGAAVDALLAGQTWFENAESAPPTPRSRDLPVTPAELGLSTRQGEVLALLLHGLPNKRIALQYGLSESTVKEHVSAILQRLGARTRVEAITRLRGRRLVLQSDDAA
jgi:DNA-binding NarL/FixJ family response regulator